MGRQYVNKLPAYYDSNASMYLRHWETRSCERKWKACKNYHVLTWVPDLGEKEPDIALCESCKAKACKCSNDVLFKYGCRCGGN